MRSLSVRALAACALFSALAAVLSAAISIPTDAPYGQAFDTLGTSATAALPSDFRLDRPATVRTVGTYAAALGSTTQAGGTNLSSTAANGAYNFGATANANDRAVGFLSSGTATQSGNLYAQLANTTPTALSGLQISYNVEKYRGGTNAAGFRIQLYYSNDGASWTSAGSDFTTAFPADAANAGYASAPGVTVGVNKALSAAIPAGGTFYLAWNYSVASGTTTSNAQALAIDDINITGIVDDTPPPDTAPAVTAIAPANGAVNVPAGSTIAVTFSESVSAAAGAFALACDGAPQTLAMGTSPASSFTLTPASPLPYTSTCTVTVAASGISDADADDPPDQMDADFVASFTTANPPPPAATNVLINEVDSDTPGTDTAEFVELYDGGAGSTSLDGLVLVFFNGNGGASYAAFDLDGYSTDANGYFTIGNPAVPGVDLVFNPGASGLLQNGEDAVALYAGNASDFPNGTLVTAANLRDAIVYDTDDADEPGLLVLLNAGQVPANENGGGSGATQSNQRCPNGAGGARNTSPYAQGAPTPGGANNCVPPPPPSNSVIVISQIYGGGGNPGAALQNDFVELYNRGAAPVDIRGWSLQYASATGSGWDFTRQPLGGTIAPGEYYLVALGSNGAEGAALPPANIQGQINLSAANGKLALVNSFTPLTGNCPTGDPSVMDFVGYGSADCREGTTTAPSPSATNAILRLGNGSIDTDRNGSDFVAGAAAPRRTAPIVELGPMVLGTDPGSNRINAARDATIQVMFTEAVDVAGAWYDITCAGSGPHNSATFAGGGQAHYITPNSPFLPGEQCTVTIFKDQVADRDLDDSAPDTDTLPANYVWTFTVAAGTAPPYPPSVHLTMGNPSGAIASVGQPDDYLMEKPEFALAYNRDLGRPNWVSWHLSDEWVGSLTRVDSFRADPAVPPDWYRVQSFDFSDTGFDRGHMVPNADRDRETSIPINQATFLMTNMLAQAPDNNQGPWAALENYLRTLLPGDELYVVAGGAGVGGSGSNGGVTATVANGHVTVPAYTWKAALVLPKDGGDDAARVSCSSRTIAVIMPNTQGIRNDLWENYLTTVDAVEALTGYDLFSNLPEPIQRCVEAGINGDNPPLVKGTQTIAFGTPVPSPTYGDQPFAITAAGGASGNPVSLTAGGACTGQGSNGSVLATIVSGGTCTITASQAGSALYEPAPDATLTITIARAAPAFSALDAPTVEAGTASVNISGTLSAGALIPAGAVAVTVGGATAQASIAADGRFTAAVPTGALAASSTPYTVAFSFAGSQNFADAAAQSSLRVVDTTAPAIAAVTTTPDDLGVPSHRMVDVTVGYTAADFSGAPACSLRVSSNEAPNTTGDGNTSVDWLVLDAHRVQLRAERSGTGTGRVYTITITCTDGAGNTSTAAGTAVVSR
ncbi:MAG TPA: DNA/RNA non-specific endonuclease [Vicinamibacterales bacterium]|nr:DNA/RNA non-specific endonuclease [Vicinamibacterales bacterium]